MAAQPLADMRTQHLWDIKLKTLPDLIPEHGHCVFADAAAFATASASYAIRLKLNWAK